MLALALSAPALAQEPSTAFDSRWSPYLGCWTIVQDQLDGRPRCQRAPWCACGRRADSASPSRPPSTARTCSSRPSSPTARRSRCLKGTAAARRPATGRGMASVSSRTSSSTARTGRSAAVSGITLLANGQWIDAQATVIDGNSDVRLRRYRRTSDQYAAAPALTTAPLTIEDVIEASAKVQSEALEAALDEVNARFALNSRVLKQLADNGVSPNVIDLLVAQAYPDKFEVERTSYPSASSTNYGGSVDGQLDGLHGIDDVSVSDVRPVLQQLLLLFAVCVSVLLGPELQLSVRIAVLSQLLQLQQLLRLWRRGILRRAVLPIRRRQRSARIARLAAAATGSSSTAAATHASGRRDQRTARAPAKAPRRPAARAVPRAACAAPAAPIQVRAQLQPELVFRIVVFGCVERRLLGRRRWWGLRRRRTDGPAAGNARFGERAETQSRDAFLSKNALCALLSALCS